MKTVSSYPFPSPGCYVDESAGSADMLNRRIVSLAETCGFTFEPALEPALLEPDLDDDYSEQLREVADDAVTFLNSLETRSYMCWTVDDNSLFLSCDVDSAREDCGFVSSRKQDYPDADYRGEWLHVSDHGNATLYFRDEAGQDKEIWGVV